MATFKDSDGNDIGFETFQPTSLGSYPCVVLAYGTRGLQDTAEYKAGKAIRNFAQALVAAGFVAVIPKYFESTGTLASKSLEEDVLVTGAFVKHQDKWIDTISQCVSHVSKLPSVDQDKIGLLGFSMGGHISLRLAKLAGAPQIRAVVDFFAPIEQPPFSIGRNINKLPPVQIHHGEDDGPPKGPVSPDQSKTLESLLAKASKVKDTDYEIYFYPGEGHGFKKSIAINESTNRTIKFLKTHLV